MALAGSVGDLHLGNRTQSASHRAYGDDSFARSPALNVGESNDEHTAPRITRWQ